MKTKKYKHSFTVETTLFDEKEAVAIFNICGQRYKIVSLMEPNMSYFEILRLMVTRKHFIIRHTIEIYQYKNSITHLNKILKKYKY